MLTKKEITFIARELRKNMTDSEQQLWHFLRGKKMGVKFLRQYPIAYYSVGYKSNYFIADFYCHAKKLVIELDGKIHDFQKDYDKNRDEILKELGLRTIRIKNEELNNLEDVLTKIRTVLNN